MFFKLLPLYWNLEQVTLYMSLSREESQFLTARCGGGGGGGTSAGDIPPACGSLNGDVRFF